MILQMFWMQVTEDQKLLREKEMHLSGGLGIERTRNSFSDTRKNYYQAVENAALMVHQLHIYHHLLLL